MTGLEEAIAANDLGRAMESIPWQRLDEMKTAIEPELMSVLQRGGAVASKDLIPKGIKIPFDKLNPESVEWVKVHAAELVTQNIVPSSQLAIRQIMQRAFEEGLPPREAAALIREHIGILPRHADAVEKYRQALIARFKDEKLITWQQDANRLAGQYANKLIKHRALVIARNETIVASNQGQHQLWQQAIGKGKLKEDDWEREWIAAPQERTCEICMGLDGKRAAINGVFPGGYDMPPAHVQCRCSAALVKKENAT